MTMHESMYTSIICYFSFALQINDDNFCNRQTGINAIIVMYMLSGHCGYSTIKRIISRCKIISLNGKYRSDDWGTLKGQLLRDGTNDEVAFKYVVYDCDDTFFMKYIARKNSL